MILLQKSRFGISGSLLGVATLLLALTQSVQSSISPLGSPDPNSSPILARADGLAPLARTNQVQFDNFSLLLQGQRVFLHSGEFHTFRLPVPSLWPDILEKVKAAGLNGVSVYTHMGLINPSPGVVDFDSFRALQPLFDAAKAAGIWIVLRPGPVR
ncbi:glycoside hydrolase superfamily [Mycena haematopus]|nr:glycoside hydrolase superfamily [Mycena haematopus]